MNKNQKILKLNKGLSIALAVLLVATVIVTVVAFTAAKRKTDDAVPTSSQTTTEQTESTSMTIPHNVKTLTPDDEPASADPVSLVCPVKGGYLIKDYSSDVPVWSMTMEDYRVHTGIDIQSDLGADVVACAAGTISEVYCDPMMGQTIVVTHDDDCVSIYRNLQTKLPEATVVGKKVASGETIGYVGDTALIEISDSPHLHFEFVCKSDNVNPLTYFSVPAASVATSYEG